MLPDAWSIAPTGFGGLVTINPRIDTLLSLGGGFVQAGNATSAGQRFTIFDQTKSKLTFDSGWLAPDALDFLIPAGSVTGGGGFGWALFYENRIDAPGLDSGSPTSIRFRSSFSGFGTAAAIPEPASWALMLAGFGAVGIAARRQQRDMLKV